MLPLAIGVMGHMDREKNPVFVFVLLGVAYGTSIGGAWYLDGFSLMCASAAGLGWGFTEWLKGLVCRS